MMILPEDLPEGFQEVTVELDDDEVIWIGPEHIARGASIEPDGGWLHVLKPRDESGRQEITTYPAGRIRSLHVVIVEPPAEPAPIWTNPGAEQPLPTPPWNPELDQ